MRKIGILCACEKELNPYIADMQDIFTTEYAMHTFYHGKIKDINMGRGRVILKLSITSSS